MTDTEFFLLGWAVVATVLMLKYKAEKEALAHMLRGLITDKRARDLIIEKWEAFKQLHGA